jgi:endoglucanase
MRVSLIAGTAPALRVPSRRNMGTNRSRRARLLLPALAVIASALALSLLGGTSGSAAAVPLSISVQGNHFVDGSGQTVRLLGVNHPSFEYACEYGYAYNDGNMNAADAAAIASWHATAVRVPLNEDCWLGINGRPSNSQGPQPPLTAAGYRQAVASYVADLTNAGLYVILDLHWTAPGGLPADGQRSMPDDHSAPFWTSVASTFAANPAVVFDVFNEPYSPAAVNDPLRPVSWDCWLSGGCQVPTDNDSVDPANDASRYVAVGMQTLVSAIRAAGAHQPILLGGLNYANDLTGWLSHKPSDPDGQLAASFHNYQGLGCDTVACWNEQVAPVAAQVPVVGGEFDQNICGPSTFDVDYMNWADQHGVSYLAWGWWVLSPQEIADAGCSAYYLITDPSGTPAAPNGVNLHDHLASLPAGGSPPPATPTTPPATTTPAPPPGKSPAPTAPAPAPALRSLSAKVRPGRSAVSVVLRASQDSAVVVSARTIGTFGAKGHKRRVALGSVSFKLVAGKSKTVVLHLARSSRTLLARQHRLKAELTITLTNAAHGRSVSRRTLTI